jgi:hypothetical protein
LSNEAYPPTATPTPGPSPQRGGQRAELAALLTRKDVLAGLMFIGIGAFGLWISRNYPIGTTLRMGTGYVPRLLCWILLGLGVCILFSGLRQPAPRYRAASAGPAAWRPVVFVTAGLVLFGLSLERLGLVVAIFLLIGVGSFASQALRPWETLAAALVLTVLSWAIFILGLGLTIPVWPDW